MALSLLAASCQQMPSEPANTDQEVRKSPNDDRSYRYLNGSGSIVKLNSGIEFAIIYLSMLLALLVIGGGRYFSFDHYLGKFIRS